MTQEKAIELALAGCNAEIISSLKSLDSEELKHIRKWIDIELKIKKKCKHLEKEEIFRSYPDQFIQEKCLFCGEKFYSDL